MRGFVHHRPVSMCGLPNLRLRREKLKRVARRVFASEAAVLEWMRTPNSAASRFPVRLRRREPHSPRARIRKSLQGRRSSGSLGLRLTPESLLDTLEGFEQALAELESASPEPR